MKDNNIELYHVYNKGKAVVVDRFNRTLGEMIQKHLTARNTSRYIAILQKLIDKYNNRYHSSIKMTPFQASDPENRDKVLNNASKDLSLNLKLVSESEYTGINAHSKKDVSLTGLRKYL